MFEAFLGAIFLDFNKLSVKDEDGWFENVFLTGPGFQVVQLFLENVFEKHVGWIYLIQNDYNYIHILQIRIQKEFKTTPYHMEINEYNMETGYHMGVYLCLGQPTFGLTHHDSISYNKFSSFSEVHQFKSEHGKIFLFLGEGVHNIKKKAAEQIACDESIRIRHLFGF